MDLDRLRRETVLDHTAVEDSVPLMTEDLSRETYVACLRRMHGVVAAWEEQARKEAPEWVETLLKNRQRRGLLERDLAWFGVHDRTSARPELPEMRDSARMAGAMYVMEGSTLGGQFIAKHVERVLGLSKGEGDAYFRGYADQTGAMWKEFCGVLRTRVPDSETDKVVAGAKEMFRVFGAWMRAGA